MMSPIFPITPHINLLTMSVVPLSVPAADRFDDCRDGYFLYEVALSGGQAYMIAEAEKRWSGHNTFIPVIVVLYTIRIFQIP